MVANLSKDQVEIETGDLRAVIFDLDGLLIDSAVLYQKAWIAAAGNLGYELSEEFYYLALYGRHLDDYAGELKQHFGSAFPLSDFADCCDKMVSQIAEADGVPVKQGARGLLQWLKAAEIPCAIGTGSGRANALLLLRNAHLEDSFDIIVCREDVRRGKPNPEVFVAAAGRLNTEPRYCVVLEDSGLGVLAAHRAGMRVVLVPDRKQPDPGSENIATVMVNNLDDARAYLEDLSDVDPNVG